MSRAASEGVSGNGKPERLGKVCAGFHYEEQVAGPGDGKSEAVRAESKIGHPGRDLRVPQNCWRTSKSRAPACGPWQVINYRIEEKNIRHRIGRSVSPEINLF